MTIKNNKNNWLAIFEYYGLELILDKNDFEPVKIYAKRGGEISSAKIVFTDGLFSNILVQNVEDESKLTEEDELLMCTIIENYLSEIIVAWLNVFVYNRTVETEVIRKKLEY